LTALAADPVATAASRSSVLSTLAAAVTEAGLADKETLTEILTYHVVGERYGPAELAAATISTLRGGTVDAATSGDEYTVNDANLGDAEPIR
jgi:uncharacterized surface protein with fasciclin (FAS1) repeats